MMGDEEAWLENKGGKLWELKHWKSKTDVSVDREGDAVGAKRRRDTVTGGIGSSGVY